MHVLERRHLTPREAQQNPVFQLRPALHWRATGAQDLSVLVPPP
jgi:hypothetical protein